MLHRACTRASIACTWDSVGSRVRLTVVYLGSRLPIFWGGVGGAGAAGAWTNRQNQPPNLDPQSGGLVLAIFEGTSYRLGVQVKDAGGCSGTGIF